MKVNSNSTGNIKEVLGKLPGIMSVTGVSIQNGIIEKVTFESTTAGNLTCRRLCLKDADTLFDFYFNGLSGKSREFFPPYPLFSPPVHSAEEIAGRIKEWQKEDDWTVLLLRKGEQIVGIGLLKRFKTEQPVSGLAVREDYHGEGMGYLIQSVINEQARLLGLDKIVITLAQDNTASFNLHKKCGFKETGNLVPHYVYKNGIKEVDRQDIEMVLELSYD